VLPGQGQCLGPRGASQSARAAAACQRNLTGIDTVQQDLEQVGKRLSKAAAGSKRPR